MPTLGKTTDRPVVAFGPELRGIGSWEWNGADLAEEFGQYFTTLTFEREVPACDVRVIVKYKLPGEVLEGAARDAAVIFCPLDYFGSSAEIDRDGPMLPRICGHLFKNESFAKFLLPEKCKRLNWPLSAGAPLALVRTISRRGDSRCR